jgi:hypothetical protein
MDWVFLINSSDIDENAVEFDIGEAISHDDLYNHPYPKDGDEETVSDDLESIQQESSDVRDTAIQSEPKVFFFNYRKSA